MFWTGFAIGCVFGGCCGVVIMAVFVVGKKSDERME